MEYLCLTLLPLAAMASLTLHLMIENGQIEVIETPVSSVKMVGESPDTLENGENDEADANSEDVDNIKSTKSAKSTQSAHSAQSNPNARSAKSVESNKNIEKTGKTENPEYSEIANFEKWLVQNSGNSEIAKTDEHNENSH